MQIAQNSVVAMHYKLTDDAGETIDSSEGRDPLHYLHGAGNIVPGLEKEMSGKKVGDKFEVKVSPEEGYGVRRDEMIQKIPKTAFKADGELEIGMRFQAQTPNGAQIFEITKVEGEEVTVDGNHPLAGQNLNFAIEVAEVREATKEEIEHGHVHGPGGHHH